MKSEVVSDGRREGTVIKDAETSKVLRLYVWKAMDLFGETPSVFALASSQAEARQLILEKYSIELDDAPQVYDKPFVYLSWGEWSDG